jgi:aspartate aminotransferase
LIRVEPHLQAVSLPANLRINDQISEYRARCEAEGCDAPYHHFAFGQSPFPPPPDVVEALAQNAKKHSYLPTAGLPELREAIAAYHVRHFRVACSGEQVVCSPGSKEMIAAIMTAVAGPVIVPTPSWVSYLPQARILKRQVIGLRTREEDGYKLAPDVLIRGIQQLGSSQKILVLNHPHNPTGAVYTEDELGELADVCRRENIVVIADEIYALTAFDFDSFTSMMKVYPEGTIVTGGLSKDRSSGGYRFGVGIFPKEPSELLESVLKVAGSTYSCVAAPVQYAALAAYSGGSSVDAYVRDCRAVNTLAGRLISSKLAALDGVKSTTPRGAFYLYADFNAQAEQFKQLDLSSCAHFCENLLEVEHTALLPGDALLLPADDYSVRCSFVDYDGEKALSAWRDDPPKDESDEMRFAQKHFEIMLAGVSNIGRYVDEIRAGKRPTHG